MAINGHASAIDEKYAEEIDGVDVRGCDVGDTLDMPKEQARLLLAEEWAMPERRSEAREPSAPPESRRDSELNLAS